jgi:arabinan endo-1,5-alpha-L-arabinosidase
MARALSIKNGKWQMAKGIFCGGLVGTLCLWAGAAAETNSVPDANAVFLQQARRGARTHDPSTVIKCKDQYWVFSTGRGIRSYHSTNLVDWEPGPPVFTNSLPWVAKAAPSNPGADFWAPDVIRLGDRYLLYFSASKFGANTSAIGLATNPTLDPGDPHYHWTDQGIVVESVSSDNFNTIDPTVFQDADKSLWLGFGSYWTGIKLIQLDPGTGKRIAADSPMYSLAWTNEIEASCLYRQSGHYYLFVNWGRCCRGVNSTYNIRVGRSDRITGPYLDKNGVDMLLGGGTLLLRTVGDFIGPGHAGILSEGGTNWLSCHFYDGTRQGAPSLALLPLRWDTNGWPEVGMPPGN